MPVKRSRPDFVDASDRVGLVLFKLVALAVAFVFVALVKPSFADR